MNETKSIAVIMTVHNRRETTLECIRRFYTCRGVDSFEVDFYLMDDGSTDGTSEAVAESFPQVILLKGDGNLFWNRGMYECWKEAIKKHHDFYLWLNDDTMLFENALEILFKNYEEAGVLSVISGCCCDTKSQSITTYGGRINDVTVPMNDQLQRVETINGNCVLIPNAVVEKIGINDPYFLHSDGDFEYGFRANRNGITTYISSSFIGTCDRHDHVNKSMDAAYSFKDRIKFMNTPWGANPREKFYLYNKYKGFWYAAKLCVRAYYRCLFPVK